MSLQVQTPPRRYWGSQFRACLTCCNPNLEMLDVEVTVGAWAMRLGTGVATARPSCLAPSPPTPQLHLLLRRLTITIRLSRPPPSHTYTQISPSRHHEPPSASVGPCKWCWSSHAPPLLTAGQPRDDVYGAYDHSHFQTAAGPNQHTQSPIVTGTSVIAAKFKDGVVIAADNLGTELKIAAVLWY